MFSEEITFRSPKGDLFKKVLGPVERMRGYSVIVEMTYGIFGHCDFRKKNWSVYFRFHRCSWKKRFASLKLPFGT